jgi:hypothetical protein
MNAALAETNFLANRESRDCGAKAGWTGQF